MNEATLEARLHPILETIFPTFRDVKVAHQESFTIHFGRHHVKVDLKAPSNYPNRAIFDMLLKSGDLNVMLVELKREGHAITDDDIEQGLSYARLIDKMPPIVLISNGTDNRLYDTYTKEKLDVKSIDLVYIQQKIDINFKMQAKEFSNVVNFLFNREPELIGKIFRGISQKNFSRLTGTISELNKPICEDFQIKRSITHRLYKDAIKAPGLFGLIGPAYSGKTSVLYQFFRNYAFRENQFALYIDLNDWNYSIFQQLANAFHLETKGTVNQDTIREWLLSLLTASEETRLFLLLDNLNNKVSDKLTEEIIEIIHMLEDSNHTIIYTIDERKFKKLAFIKERNYKTLLGNLTKTYLLKELDLIEYNRVNKYLYKTVHAAIIPGGHLSSEYRDARSLRRLASLYAGSSEKAYGQVVSINSIPDYNTIKALASNTIFTNATKEYYKKMAAVYVLDQAYRKQIPELNILAFTQMAITRAGYIHHFSAKEYKKLLETGLVVEREYIEGVVTIIPKVQELLIINIVGFLFEMIRSKHRKEDYHAIFDYYLSALSHLPDSDIIGAALLSKISYWDVDLYTFIIVSLTKQKPKSETLDKNSRILLFSEKKGLFDYTINDDLDGEENTMSHSTSYAILAQMAYPPFAAESPEGINFDYYLELLYHLGAEPAIIHRMGYGSLEKAQKVYNQHVPGWGKVLSVKNGIIETITQSIMRCFVAETEIIERLFDLAVEQSAKPLLWRLYLVFSFTETLVDKKLAEKARYMKKEITKIFTKDMNDFFGIDVVLPAEPDSKDSE